MNIDISEHLNTLGEEYVKQLCFHVEKRQPFIIYFDKENYLACYPAELRVAGFANGEQQTGEDMRDEQAFINRLKLAVLLYPNFHSLKPLISHEVQTTVAIPNELINIEAEDPVYELQ